MIHKNEKPTLGVMPLHLWEEAFPNPSVADLVGRYMDVDDAVARTRSRGMIVLDEECIGFVRDCIKVQVALKSQGQYIVYMSMYPIDKAIQARLKALKPRLLPWLTEKDLLCGWLLELGCMPMSIVEEFR